MAKTKYTYKYNGVVVRNSNNLYKYGLVNHAGKVVTCSGTEYGAAKNIQSQRKTYESKLKLFQEKNLQENIKYYTEMLENIKMWHVVELEIIENK